jgi:hypothetical protein
VRANRPYRHGSRISAFEKTSAYRRYLFLSEREAHDRIAVLGGQTRCERLHEEIDVVLAVDGIDDTAAVGQREPDRVDDRSDIDGFERNIALCRDPASEGRDLVQYAVHRDSR